MIPPSPAQTRRSRGTKCYKQSCLVIGACCGGLGHYYRKFGCKHITPLLILVIYTILAALFLHYFEFPEENEREIERQAQMDALRNDTSVKLAAVLGDGIMSDETKLMQTRDWVRWYEKQLGVKQDHTIQWDMWGALFYVGTIYTTIGYGNITPSTAAGRLLTVVYAIFGIPLVLAILNDLGQLFRHWINQFWLYLINYRCRRWYQPASSQSKSPALVTDDSTSEDDDESAQIPISLALALTVGWVLFCSGLFCLWETDWTYSTSLYFFFISLSTIGLGDVVPSKPQYMIANFGFVIIGLCLVSMTLGVIQQRIEEFLYRMMKLLREEYEAATEQDVTDCRPDRILEKAWRKQPWYVRALAPRVLTNNARARLDQCAVRLVRGDPFGAIARDLMVFKHQDELDKIDSTRTQPSHRPSAPSCFQPAKYNETQLHPVSDSPPTRFFCDTSAQTDRETASADFLFFENEEHDSRRLPKTDRQSFLFPQSLLFPQRPNGRDAAIQACIRVQTVHVGVGDCSTVEEQSKEKKKNKSTATDKRKDKNAKTQTVEWKIERHAKAIQTDDSYLRLASKLEALRRNRADSLAVVVSSSVRKPSLPHNDISTRKQSTSLNV